MTASACRAGACPPPRHRQGTRLCPTVFVLAALLALPLASPAAAQSPDTFTIAGHVLNGTAGGVAPREGRVQAYAYTRERVDGPWDAAIDDSGAYRVDNVPRVEGATYVVGTDYGGALYAERLDNPGDEQVVTKDVTIYDSSTVDPGIQFDQVAILVSAVDAGQGILSILEIHRLENPTDRTFAPSTSGPGGPAGLLVFPLPPNAFDLRPDVGLDPFRLVQIDRGFASLAPIQPGRTEIGFSYKFPYTEESVQLSRNVRYPIARLSVLVPQGGPSVATDQLSPTDAASFGGRPYRTFTGGPLSPGQAVQINLTGLPVPGGPLGRVPPAAAAFVGVIIGLGVLLWASLRPRAGAEALTATTDSLIDRIVALDLDRAESRIPDVEYRRERQALVQRLPSSEERASEERAGEERAGEERAVAGP